MSLNGIAALISVNPYRIGRKGEKRAKTNCLYYDVVNNHKGTFSEMLYRITEWLKKTKGIEKLKTMNDVDRIELDMGVFIGEEAISSSYAMTANFLQVTSDLGLSITISIYKSEKADKEKAP